VPASAERWGLPFDHYTGEYEYIPEDQPVFIGEERLEVLFTPGHSPGSLSFYYEPGGFIIGGDVLFDRSVGRTDLPGGDAAILLNSIQTKFFTLPDETKVYAGHGAVTTVGFEKMNNPFVKMF
ncbi:MAG: MBL fold metallo-hydrolase, partial [Chitinophagaceae bacterium]|nr:MBL fold metallo-hydrolase [Chitinophagaceae bacterium]